MERTHKEQAFCDYLETLSITELRILARLYGVPQSTSTVKEKLVSSIAGVLCGTYVPPPRSKRGAPAKQKFVDPAIMTKLDEIARTFASRDIVLTSGSGHNGPELTVSSPDRPLNPYEENIYGGILEITPGGYGFLRTRNCQPSANGDVFLAASTIHAFHLREGDYVTCTAKPRQKNDSPAIDELRSVNGLSVGQYEYRASFDFLTAQYAKERILLSKNSSNISLRLLDLFIPIGKGQRALIIAPPKAGKTTLLKEIAHSINTNYPSMELIVLLIDERPEEVTDIKESVNGATVIYSTFDESADRHVRAATLIIEHAKRLAEQGKDVVILLDSLTKLTRAHNFLTESTGKTLTGGLDAAAFIEPKKFFGAARNTVEAGSITILATVLVETGSRMDDIIYEEFKGTGNADIFLSRALAERRIFPAIDVRKSGTRKEELLLGKEELAAVYKMRERGVVENSAGLIEMFQRTRNNEEFIARVPEWLKIYKAQ